MTKNIKGWGDWTLPDKFHETGIENANDEAYLIVPINDGRYLVSSDGQIFTCYHKKLSVMKQFLDKDGYYRVSLNMSDGSRKDCLVHRLVAYCFVENPDMDRFKSVNHKNEDRHDNRAENLEWVDIETNVKYSIHKIALSAQKVQRKIAMEKLKFMPAEGKTEFPDMARKKYQHRNHLYVIQRKDGSKIYAFSQEDMAKKIGFSKTAIQKFISRQYTYCQMDDLGYKYLGKITRGDEGWPAELN